MKKTILQQIQGNDPLVENPRNVVQGTVAGFTVSVMFGAGNGTSWRVVIDARPGAAPPAYPMDQFLAEMRTGLKKVTSAVYDGKRMEVILGTSSQAGLQIRSILDHAASYLVQNGYVPCCGCCGEQVPTRLSSINGYMDFTCDACYGRLCQSLEANRQQLKEKPGNMFTGIVGALLGALIGGVLWVVIYQLGYIAGIAGLVAAVCALKGYEKFGGKINWFPDMLSAVLDNLKISHDDAPMTPTERGILQPEGFYFNDGTQKTRAVLVHYQPVISWANAATYVNSMLSKDGAVMEKWNPDEVEETVPVPLDIRGTCCIFRVAGQSMEPAINDGDILYCEQVLDLKTIPDKRVVVVLFADCSKFEDCIVCKRFRKIGEKILLASDNPIGREFEVEPKDISWIGILRKLTKNGDSI